MRLIILLRCPIFDFCLPLSPCVLSCCFRSLNPSLHKVAETPKGGDEPPISVHSLEGIFIFVVDNVHGFLEEGQKSSPLGFVVVPPMRVSVGGYDTRCWSLRGGFKEVRAQRQGRPEVGVSSIGRGRIAVIRWGQNLREKRRWWWCCCWWVSSWCSWWVPSHIPERDAIRRPHSLAVVLISLHIDQVNR